MWLVIRFFAALLLGLTLVTTWYATYYLARRDAAQPVPFAFGGEAKPTDYARAIADGSVLALLACLGLAQLAHETSPALLHMSLVGLAFFGGSCYRYHPIKSALALLLAITGLIALFGTSHSFHVVYWLNFAHWRNSAHLLVWFAWPAWALALLALVKWRRHWICRHPALHITLPLAFVLIHLLVLPIAPQPDRWFLAALPALSSLAAFALPTLRRSMKSLIDLFTLVFFSGAALVVWIVWLAMETGIPPQPAANVARLAPLFTPSYSAPVVLLALAATIAWAWLVVWRLGKHRPAIWMSMVLPAGGAALSWVLLMTLWLPLLDHARSYKPLMQQVQRMIAPKLPTCIQTHGLSAAQRAALRYYVAQPQQEANRGIECQWLIVDGLSQENLPEYVKREDWQLKATLRRPTDDNEDWLIYQRQP